MPTWFAYEYCTDIAATREFYGELIGLTILWDGPDVVAFEHDGVQVSFELVESLQRPSGWAFQPGWCHGRLPDAPPTEKVRSISIALPPERFREAVSRLQAAEVERLRPEPIWVGYWSFVVEAPDGLTLELADPETPEAMGATRSG